MIFNCYFFYCVRWCCSVVIVIVVVDIDKVFFFSSKCDFDIKYKLSNWEASNLIDLCSIWYSHIHRTKFIQFQYTYRRLLRTFVDSVLNDNNPCSAFRFIWTNKEMCNDAHNKPHMYYKYLAKNKTASAHHKTIRIYAVCSCLQEQLYDLVMGFCWLLLLLLLLMLKK